MGRLLALIALVALVGCKQPPVSSNSRSVKSVAAGPVCTCSPSPVPTCTPAPVTPTPTAAPTNAPSVIAQNTRSLNSVFPYGVPSSFGFQGGAVQENAGPPSGYTSGTGWIVIAPASTNASNPTAAHVTLRLQTFAHLKTETWTLLTDTNSVGWGGLLYAASNYAAVGGYTTISNGPPIVVAGPAAGQIEHLYSASRVGFTAGSVDGIYVVLTGSSSGGTPIVVQTGADWYLYANQPQPGNPMPPGAGLSNWMQLTATPSQLRYLSNMALVNNLPA
jgi:hypothetical protein